MFDVLYFYIFFFGGGGGGSGAKSTPAGPPRFFLGTPEGREGVECGVGGARGGEREGRIGEGDFFLGPTGLVGVCCGAGRKLGTWRSGRSGRRPEGVERSWAGRAFGGVEKQEGVGVGKFGGALRGRREEKGGRIFLEWVEFL